jgi:hypothetical protein
MRPASPLSNDAHAMPASGRRRGVLLLVPPLPRRVAALALLLCAAAAVAGLPVVAAQDADNDGVSDGADACPESSRGARDHVDAHGCEQDQVDVDRDGWCNPDRPRDANNKWLETRDEWCMGIDNCKLVYNPDQTQNLTADAPSDADGHGDACNTSELSGVLVLVQCPALGSSCLTVVVRCCRS